MANNGIFDAVFDAVADEVESAPAVQLTRDNYRATVALILDSNGPHGYLPEMMTQLEENVTVFLLAAMRAAFLAGMQFTSSTLLVSLAPGGKRQ